MPSFMRRGAKLIALLLVCSVPAIAAESVPSAKDVLFNRAHIAEVAPGTVLDYKFVRKPSDEKMLGAGFSDDIKVTVEGDGAPGKKNVRVDVYSGDRAREPQRITDMDGNPVLVVFLDNAVAHFRQLAGGDGAYLKNMFSQYLGTGATVAPVKISYKGQDVDGYQIKAMPYEKDPAKTRMNGYENAVFTIALSDKIPGYFAEMVSTFKSTDATAPSLIETTTLDGVGEVK